MLFEVFIPYSKKITVPFFLCSDVHFDNPKADRTLFFKHLDAAKEMGAGFLCFGDFFCLMQGKYDPRRSKRGIRPEHNKENYIDEVITDTADKMKGYSENMLLWTDGNHETSILRNLETDPLERFCFQMRSQHQSPVLHGGYNGFVRFRFRGETGGTRTFLLYFHHGKYGGAVTKGVLGVSRHGLVIPQADAVITGHTHDQWIVSQPRLKVNRYGKVFIHKQWHIKTGTYKEEFAQPGGWAVEKIAQPKSTGSWIMELTPNLRGSGCSVNFRSLD